MVVRSVRVILMVGLLLGLQTTSTSCILDRAPDDLGRTPPGPGATIRYDLGHQPLPDIPIPIDTACWPDPTSRTGLRINASLVAPTTIERQARERFSQMEGWGTFAPISVSFDVDHSDPGYEDYDGPALDINNLRARHLGDDYDFGDDAVYLINLDTGVPAVLDVGAGNFDYILKKLDKYWANDTRRSERNLLFETIDETGGGTIDVYAPQFDTDFDGVLDRPNLTSLDACPNADPICDDHNSGSEYKSAACKLKRQQRDRCIADHLLTGYERETDTLLVRPLLPLDEMTRYAVVLTDRLIDGRGNAVKSPFELIYHATQRQTAERVQQILNEPTLASYFGDVHGTGLGRVAFLWSFTTQPTVDDMKRLRDGLYGAGPFARWASEYPVQIELQRATGLTGQLAEGATDGEGWQTSSTGVTAGCPAKANNLYIVDYDGIRDTMEDLFVQGFDMDDGPTMQLLLRRFDAIDHMVVATYQVPFLLEGGPTNTDPNSAFDLNFQTGDGEVSTDTVQFWLVVPKATEERSQPFDVNIYGHGYTGNFVEMMLYAGNMAEHGLATVGINAMGHGLVFDDEGTKLLARGLLASECYAPFSDALVLGRTRDLNLDGIADSGGDFWSSYLFHTRDGVRQSVLDHIQLVRILRSFGVGGTMMCRNDGDKANPLKECDINGDGNADIFGDFDADGVPDVGGPSAIYGTWGESLGGILSAIHGAIDAYVTVAVPGSGGGGLTDIGIRSFQGGVIEAVLLRIWGPLIVSVPAEDRKECTAASTDEDRCTMCDAGQVSLRWVLPDVNGTGEVEITCVQPEDIATSTVLVRNLDNGELRCGRVDDEYRFRIGLPASWGDRVTISFWDGTDSVASYDGCQLLDGVALRHVVDQWGPGRHATGKTNAVDSASCDCASCTSFQGYFYGQGTALISPGHGFGHIRQTPALRRFIGLAQAALEPGDPVSFAPYYALKSMTDPFGHIITPHAVLTLNTIGDMNVPLNTGIAFARATGALPFFRPDQAAQYPDYADYATPEALYQQLGSQTPNQQLIDQHVIEGITALARHPAGQACAESANAASLDATFLTADGEQLSCYPNGCSEESEADSDTRICYSGTQCEIPAGQTEGSCVPRTLGQSKCDEALYDADDLDEGQQLFYEQHTSVPHRLARLTASVNSSSLEQVWAPRLEGQPFSADNSGYQPEKAPSGRLTALLNAYMVLQGTHTFENGQPCHSFDTETYLTNLVARFFQTDGTDLYFLSHPASHHCLATQVASCDYQLP